MVHKSIIGTAAWALALALSHTSALALSCDDAKTVKSRNGGKNVTIKFVNTSGEMRTAFWIDFNGKMVQYFTLNPGESYSQQTWTTHPWVFTDGPGNCIEALWPPKNKKTYKISVQSPGFGDE